MRFRPVCLVLFCASTPAALVLQTDAEASPEEVDANSCKGAAAALRRSLDTPAVREGLARLVAQLEDPAARKELEKVAARVTAELRGVQEQLADPEVRAALAKEAAALQASPRWQEVRAQLDRELDRALREAGQELKAREEHKAEPESSFVEAGPSKLLSLALPLLTPAEGFNTALLARAPARQVSGFQAPPFLRGPVRSGRSRSLLMELEDPAPAESAEPSAPAERGALDLGASQDASAFSMQTAKKGDIATLASLPLIWSYMVLEARVLCGGDAALTPTACVLATQLATVPLFAASLATAGSDGEEVDKALVLKAGTALGLLWTLGGWLQTAGFAAGASASHGAFLTQMTTLIVPLLTLLRGDKLPTNIIIACALALPGIAAFAADAGSAGSSSTLTGDAICGLAALAYATYDITLAGVGGSLRADQLNVVRALVGTVGAAGTAAALGEPLDSLTTALTAYDAPLAESATRFTETLANDGLAPAVAAAASVPAVGIAALGVANAASATIQPKAHAAVPPAFSQVFYAQTPLWTSLLAAFALHEQFSPTALLGVAAFTASLGVAACPDDVVRAQIGMETRGSPLRNGLAVAKRLLRENAR